MEENQKLPILLQALKAAITVFANPCNVDYEVVQHVTSRHTLYFR